MPILNPNLPDFLIWRAAKGSVMAKFRVVGILKAKDGQTHLSLPRADFFDTSKVVDPTIGVMSIVQIQVDGLTLDELSNLSDLEVRVQTEDGQEVEHFQESEEEGFFEYGSKSPLIVVVKNWKLNKQTIYTASIEQAPHKSFKNEALFHLNVESKGEHLEMLTDHPKFEAQKPKPENGDGHELDEEVGQAAKDAIAATQLGLDSTTSKVRESKAKPEDGASPKPRNGKGAKAKEKRDVPNVKGMSADQAAEVIN